MSDIPDIPDQWRPSYAPIYRQGQGWRDRTDGTREFIDEDGIVHSWTRFVGIAADVAAEMEGEA